MTTHAQLTLNDVETRLRNNDMARADVIEYLRAWNKGPHFTQAYLIGTTIFNAEPEKIPRHHYQYALECHAKHN